MKLKLNNNKLITSDSIPLDSARRVLVFILLITLISGCTRTKYAPSKLQDSQTVNNLGASLKPNISNAADLKNSDIADIRKVKDILIAPVQSDSMTRNIVLAGSQTDLIQNEFEQAFKSTSKLEVKTLSELLKVKNVDSSNSESLKKYDRKAITKLAAQNGLSSVLFISVSKLQERSGSSFGSNELASLGLSAQILDLNMTPLWNSAYDYSDSVKPLISFDNGKLASLGFKSIEDLVKEAAKHVVDDFVATRQKAFAKQ